MYCCHLFQDASVQKHIQQFTLMYCETNVVNLNFYELLHRARVKKPDFYELSVPQKNYFSHDYKQF